MVEYNEPQAFPVIFFDGMTEANIGKIKVYPTLEFKPFQLMLSQKIGISPNQISIYLVEQWAHKKSMFGDDRRRIPITGKVNFRIICRQKDCCFLVVLKRSRKMRNRRDRVEFLNVNEFSPVLLRRNESISQVEMANLNARLQSLNFHRENYQLAVNGGIGYDYGLDLNPNSYPGLDLFPVMEMKKRVIYCQECENLRENGPATSFSFHHCVNDEVVSGYYVSPFGPICRPGNRVR